MNKVTETILNWLMPIAITVTIATIIAKEMV
jgi:hypothetical protein